MNLDYTRGFLHSLLDCPLARKVAAESKRTKSPSRSPRLTIERLEDRRPMDGSGIVITDAAPNGAETAYGLAVQADGKLVTSGTAYVGNKKNPWDMLLVRYNSDGSLDSSFSGDGIATSNLVDGSEGFFALTIQSDQKIVAAGRVPGVRKTWMTRMAVARFLSDGSLDPSFDADGWVATAFPGRASASDVEIQPDLKIVVTGRMQEASGQETFGVVRYQPNGALDTSFAGTGKVTTDFGVGSIVANALAIQADGKIIAAGGVWYPAPTHFLIARYNQDGTLDTSFDGDGRVIHPLPGSGGGISNVALQADGKIVASGANAHGDGYVVRYNADGSLDTSFWNSGVVSVANFTAYGMGLQSDGKIVVGDYSGFQTTRLNVDGSPDTYFAGTGMTSELYPGGEGWTLVVQPDGRIVRSGNADSTASRNLILLLASDGTLDPTFCGTTCASVASASVAPVSPAAFLSIDVAVLSASVVAQPPLPGKPRIDGLLPADKLDLRTFPAAPPVRTDAARVAAFESWSDADASSSHSAATKRATDDAFHRIAADGHWAALALAPEDKIL